MAHPGTPQADRTGWHVPDGTAAAYADGTLADSAAWSVDKHLESCAACAARISSLARAGGGGAVLCEVRDAVLTAATGTAPRPAPPSRGRPGPVPGTPPSAPRARCVRPGWRRCC